MTNQTQAVAQTAKIRTPFEILRGDGSLLLKNNGFSGRTPEKKQGSKPPATVVKTAPEKKEHEISDMEAEKNLREYQKRMAARKAKKIAAAVENTAAARAGRFDPAAAARAPRMAKGKKTNCPRLSQEAKGKTGGAPQGTKKSAKTKGKAGK